MKNIANNKVTKFMAILIGLLVSTSVLAQNGNVREETARQVGLNFLRLKDGSPRSDLQLTRVDAVQYPNLYVYNTSENGFIVVASDNRMEPILAYSDEGTFDKDNVAPGANFWFEMYEYAIDSIVRNNVRDVDEKIIRKWEDLINGIMPEPERSGNYPSSYGPLIRTRWGQGNAVSWNNDYNALCPWVIKNGQKMKALTGCAATSLAQVLYFHGRLLSGYSDIYYSFRHVGNDVLNLDDNYPYGQTHQSVAKNGCVLPTRYKYRFGGWRNNNGSLNLAKMMLDCGLAVDMSYGLSVSQAWNLESRACHAEKSIEYALKHHFNYPDAHGYERFNNESQWMDTIKKYICHNLPVFYYGWHRINGAHEFICDGYVGNYFHFNFGWKGTSDGYYSINALEPPRPSNSSLNYYFDFYQSAVFTDKKSDEWVVYSDIIIMGDTKERDWCGGFVNAMQGEANGQTQQTGQLLIYDHPDNYILVTDRCVANNKRLMWKVTVLPAVCFIPKEEDETICRRSRYERDFTYQDINGTVHFSLSRDETDFPNASPTTFREYIKDNTGSIVGECILTLTTAGIVNEILPPTIVNKEFCDLLDQKGEPIDYEWNVPGGPLYYDKTGHYEHIIGGNYPPNCETVYYLDLTISEPEIDDNNVTSVITCSNSYHWDKNNQDYYPNEFPEGRGKRYYCDNNVLYVLDIEFTDKIDEIVEETVCIKNQPFDFHGQSISESQIGTYADYQPYVEHLNNSCDKYYYLVLTITDDCCTADLDCLKEKVNEGNRSASSNMEAIYYGLKHYYEYRDATNDFLFNVFNGMSWPSMEGRNTFWNLFQSLLDSNTGMMSEEAKQQLFATNPYDYITEEYIEELVERYNRSVMYWNEGSYTYWELPEGYNPDFIEYDTASMNKAYEAYDYAIAHGFGDVKAMYDNAYELLAAEVDNIQSSVCAKVTVQFNQKMTMTREAFNGTLQIFNGHESIPMEDILVDFRIEDQQGNDCTNLFQINTLSLDQITGISGDGSLAAQTNGRALVQFIPMKNAAPTEPKVYSFGGSFSFIDPFTGEGLTYPLYPVEITVNPSPDLYVDYFMQRNILGDNALTEDIVEPTVPAELGVIIHNQGAGEAKNVTLETAEPQIIDNERGLAIDFAMYGASFNGTPRQLGLTEIRFGNIGSGQTAVGEWLFTSSLLGHFVSYEANVIHNSSYGNSDLSLVSHLDIHELIHPIYAYGNLDDGINDFLVNDNPDAYDQPDSIYFSHGGKTSVGVVDDISFDHLVSPSDTIVMLTVEPSRVGWNYGVTDDPGMNQYNIVRCIRNNDNQEIPLNNVWLTFVTIPDGGDPVYENKLHIVDTIPVQQTTTYTLVFEYNPNANYSMAQNMSLSQGWNWWSTYIEQSNIDGLSMLEQSLGHKGVTIKSQFDFVQNFYSDYGEDVWFGSLEGITNEQGYMIDVTEDCAPIMSGKRTKPTSHPITLQPNWNWIGYPVDSRQSVVSALSDFNASPEDLIKNQYEFSIYYDGFGWFPDDLVMNPGEGYLYYSNATGSQLLTYSNSSRDALPEKTDNRMWKTDVHAFADNISIIAVVSIDSVEQRDEKLELGAFVDGECRGSALLKHFGPSDRYYAMLSVSGQDGDMVEFGFINKKKGQGSKVSENHITFVRNGIMGSLDTPYVVNFNTLKDEAQEGSMVLFPNPVERNKTFNLDLPKNEMLKEIVIVDMLGEEVLRKTGALKSNEIAGLPVAGIYVVKAITESGNVYHGRLIVK